MKKIKFSKLLRNWCIIAFLLLLLNMIFIKNYILHSIILASLGVILLVYPVYPDSLKEKYDEKKCKLLIRIVAVIEIALAFLVRTFF